MTVPYHYYPPTFTVTKGFLPQWENVLEIGDNNLWGSLDVISTTYVLYDASVGLQENGGWQVGACDDVSFEASRTLEAEEIGNVIDSGVLRLTGEEYNVTFTAKEWQPETVAFGMGQTWNAIGPSNGILTFGGGCAINSRPVVVSGTNVSCDASAITDLTDGVKYMVLTFYDCFPSEGVTMNINVRENEGMEIPLRCLPVLSLAEGNRVGNLFMATD
jgi:hypothetical protein